MKNPNLVYITKRIFSHSKNTKLEVLKAERIGAEYYKILSPAPPAHLETLSVKLFIEVSGPEREIADLELLELMIEARANGENISDREITTAKIRAVNSSLFFINTYSIEVFFFYCKTNFY